MTNTGETKPGPTFSVVQRTAAPQPAAVAHEGSGFKPGIEDDSGRGALGMSLGVVGGFALGYLVLVPLLPKARTTEAVLLMTTLTMVSMVGLGVVGYFLTRKRRRK